MATTTTATPPAVTPATSTTSDGPVLTVIAKRIRALRKKHTRILQMEQSLSQGKPLNSEQLEVVRSKPAVEALLDELEKLRAPISAAVDEELSVEYEKREELMEDFVKLMYFGSLFDVKAQSEFTLYTKTLERGSCLTYDIVTDDAVDGDMLIESDLDLISALQGLMIARPVNSELSHRNALDLCLKHAKLWISNADQPIDSQTNVTYAALRAKLNKIISSGYFIATPQMRGAGEVAAAAAGGNYGLFQVPTQESTVNVEVPVQVEVEGSTEQNQETEEDAGNYEEHETAGHQSSNIEVFQKDDLESENPPEVVPSQTEQEQPQNTEEENGHINVDFKDQQYGNRRGLRGGVRGGGRRGYSNGRGGRGTGRGNGTYQNGRGQYYDNYYPRNNYYNRRGGRGGGGGGGGGQYNNSSGDHGNHSQENIGAAS